MKDFALNVVVDANFNPDGSKASVVQFANGNKLQVDREDNLLTLVNEIVELDQKVESSTFRSVFKLHEHLDFVRLELDKLSPKPADPVLILLVEHRPNTSGRRDKARTAIGELRAAFPGLSVQCVVFQQSEQMNNFYKNDICNTSNDKHHRVLGPNNLKRRSDKIAQAICPTE